MLSIAIGEAQPKNHNIMEYGPRIPKYQCATCMLASFNIRGAQGRASAGIDVLESSSISSFSLFSHFFLFFTIFGKFFAVRGYLPHPPPPLFMLLAYSGTGLSHVSMSAKLLWVTLSSYLPST